MALNLIYSWEDDFRSFCQPRPNRRDETGSALSPAHVEIKPGVDLVKVPQYPVPLEAKKDIAPHVRQLPDLGVLQAHAISLEHAFTAC